MSQRTKSAAPPSLCRRRFALVPLGPPLLTYSSTSKVWAVCVSVWCACITEPQPPGWWWAGALRTSKCMQCPPCECQTAPIGPCRTNPAAHARFTGPSRSRCTRAVVFDAACFPFL